MKKKKNDISHASEIVSKNLSKRLWEKNWAYVKTVVETVREPILVLDKDLRVITANESFYKTFQVDLKDTEKKLVYELGNGEWDIPSLRKLLEDILPKNNFFNGFEVVHDFPFIGRKVMILNARQIHLKEDDTEEIFQPIILLAIEDASEIIFLAETLAGHANLFEDKFAEKTRNLESNLVKLEKEVEELKLHKL